MLWISISCSRASDYGLMKIDDTGRVVQFAEKPKGADLKAMVLNFTSARCLMLIFLQPSSRNLGFSKDFSWNVVPAGVPWPSFNICFLFFLQLQQVDTALLGLSKLDAMKYPYIASMGVYVFRTDVLLKLLRWSYPYSNDFGSEIIPSAVREHNVQVRQRFRQRFHLFILFYIFHT